MIKFILIAFIILVILVALNYSTFTKIIDPVTIILTCTVNVHDNINTLKMKNADERKNIYLKSIKNWLYKTNFNIIVVENSGYSFPELKQELIKFKNRFEIISKHIILNDSSKGIHEIYAINYAYNNSKLIKLLDENSIVIKVTGRYFIPQLEEYIGQNSFNIITQNNPKNCEMLGCKKKYFNNLFNMNIEKFMFFPVYIENVYFKRTSLFPKNEVLNSKLFQIEPTKNGGYGVLKSVL